MSQKKKSSYTPKAIEDFDSSVLAQEIVEAVEELTEVEWLDEPIVVERPIVPPQTHIVGPKDTMATIAALYCPKNMDVETYYVHLNLLNNRPQLVKGMQIKLFGGN